MSTFKLSLTTPEVESKTTNTIKVMDINVRDLLSETGPTAIVTLERGEVSGEDYTVHERKHYKVSKANLDTELGKTVVGTDTVREAIERASLAALQASGEIGAGTLE